ncbi:hypothetical protein [Phenylobacterium sp.]|uniref:hypothetical protein n=1 Tax=Phenylobacterium sp. TaxID=1871053 RepID=UPI00273604C7|nr:hypothetical protein [Phenylobacterium sp.]MDP3852630.1 hypothetical protein [Phenylobacterium sp.]
MDRESDVRGEVVIARLHALVRAGYRPDVGVERTKGAVTFKHPRKAAEVTLWGDGRVVDGAPSFIANDSNQTVIEASDTTGFERFIADSPSPIAVRKVGSSLLETVILAAAAWAILIGAVYSFWRLSQFVLGAVIQAVTSG